jgi:hypothetical protein
LYREFRNEFDCWASVTISQNYDEDEVLRNILHQIKTPDILGQSKLQDMEQEQQGRKSSLKRFVTLICCHMNKKVAVDEQKRPLDEKRCL